MREKISIGFEASFLAADNLRGIGNMSFEIVKETRKYPDYQFFLFSNKKHDRLQKLSKHKNIKIIYIRAPFILYEQLLLPLTVRRYKLDVFQFFGNTASVLMKPTRHSFVTICDVIYLQSTIFTWLRQRRYGNIYRSLIVRLQQIQNYDIIFISNFTKDRYNDFFKSGLTKTEVIYLAADSTSGSNVTNDVSWVGSTFGNYYCAIGALDQRKNTNFLIECYLETKLFSEKKIRLVVFGLEDVDYFCASNNLSRADLEKNGVSILGFQSENDKLSLISNSNGFIFLSTYEGFGIPILEAMKCGVKVLASNTTSCKEIAGNFALTVNPKDRKSVIEALEDFESYEFDKKAQLDYATRFTWSETAAKYFKFYESVAQSGDKV